MATETRRPLQEREPTRRAGRVQSFYEELKENVRYRSLWEEVSGSLGDLGTFVPIVIALTLVNGLDLGTTLIFTGAFNIITGKRSSQNPRFLGLGLVQGCSCTLANGRGVVGFVPKSCACREGA